MFDLVYRFDPTGRHTPTPPADADAAVERLEAGNREFARLLDPGHQSARVELRFDADDLGFPQEDGSPPTQTPFAAVLACSDARVPTEMIFGQAVNDLFVVRVAGNVLGDECLGSLDYALSALGDSLKLVVVLGHSRCGAVTAAVDAFLHPSRYLDVAASQPLRAVVNRVYAAVRAAHAGLVAVYGRAVEDRPGFRAALIDTAVPLNAAMSAATVRDELAGRLGGRRKVVYGVFDLFTKRISLPLDPDDRVAIHLAAPPADPRAFEHLGLLVAGGASVRGLLG
ncbi:MAG: carbonic anhydrase [Gemmataceae bacterium]